MGLHSGLELMYFALYIPYAVYYMNSIPYTLYIYMCISYTIYYGLPWKWLPRHEILKAHKHELSASPGSGRGSYPDPCTLAAFKFWQVKHCLLFWLFEGGIDRASLKGI